MKKALSAAGEVKIPPGQRFERSRVIYLALGLSIVDLQKWKLSVTGLIEKQLSYSYNELVKSPLMVKLKRNFFTV